MFQKLKAIFNHPYAAPFAQPIRNVATFTYTPIGGFVEALKHGFDDSKYWDPKDLKRSKLLRALSEATDASSASAELTVVAGVAIGFLGGIFGSVTAASAGLIGPVAAVPAGIALTALSVAVGPFALAGTLAAGAFVIGCTLGIVPGVIQGLKTAIDHAKNPQPAQTQSAPALVAQVQWPNPQSPASAESGKSIVEQLADLAPEDRRKELEKLQTAFTEDYKALFNERVKNGIQEPIGILRPIQIKKRATPATDAAP